MGRAIRVCAEFISKEFDSIEFDKAGLAQTGLVPIVRRVAIADKKIVAFFKPDNKLLSMLNQVVVINNLMIRFLGYHNKLISLIPIESDSIYL